MKLHPQGMLGKHHSQKTKQRISSTLRKRNNSSFTVDDLNQLILEERIFIGVVEVIKERLRRMHAHSKEDV